MQKQNLDFAYILDGLKVNTYSADLHFLGKIPLIIVNPI